MTTKKLMSLVSFMTFAHFANAQEYAVDKGATFISGMAGFSSQGGELYSGGGNDRLTTIMLTPSVSCFVARNFFIGGALEFSYQAQSGANFNSIAVGPHFGYGGGSATSTAFPFFSAGLRYYHAGYDYGSSFFGDSKLSGTDVVLGAGVVAALKSHLGMTFEASYHLLNLKESDSNFSASGNTISIGIGFTGLLFKDAAKK